MPNLFPELVFLVPEGVHPLVVLVFGTAVQLVLRLQDPLQGWV